MAHRIIKEISTFIKAQSSALLATGADYAVLFLCDKVLGLNFYVATLIGAISGGILNCCVNYRFVFKATDRRKRDIAWRYAFIWMGSIVLNFLGTLLLKGGMHVKAYYARIITSMVVAIVWNYGMQRWFVFGNKKEK